MSNKTVKVEVKHVGETKQTMSVCGQCAGKGMIAGLSNKTVVQCPNCDGTGYVSLILAVRQQEIGKTMETKETVQHPSHYNEGKYEVIDVIEDWKLGFNDGNAVKYIGRHRHKNHPAEDLKKALWYIARELVITHSVPADELAQAIRTVVKTKN